LTHESRRFEDNEAIKRLIEQLEHERPSDRYERILAAMAQARVEKCGCEFDDALSCVLASPGGLALYERLLKARVRER